MPERYQSNIHSTMTKPGDRGRADRLAILYEVNPWTSQEQLEQVLIYRGAVIAAWANLEVAISKLAIRCSKHPLYGEKRRTNMPFTMEGRMKYLEEVLRTPGPLSKYRLFGLAYFERYRVLSSSRHTLAHARMEVMGSWGITFEEIVPDGAAITVRRSRVQMGELAALSRKLCRFARVSQYALSRIEGEKLLPALD